MLTNEKSISIILNATAHYLHYAMDDTERHLEMLWKNFGNQTTVLNTFFVYRLNVWVTVFTIRPNP